MSCHYQIWQAAEKFKAPQPAPVIPEAKAVTAEQEEESEEEEVRVPSNFIFVLIDYGNQCHNIGSHEYAEVFSYKAYFVIRRTLL